VTFAPSVKKTKNKADTGKLLYCSPDLENMFKPPSAVKKEAEVPETKKEPVVQKEAAVKEVVKPKVEKNTPKETKKAPEKK